MPKHGHSDSDDDIVFLSETKKARPHGTNSDKSDDIQIINSVTPKPPVIAQAPPAAAKENRVYLSAVHDVVDAKFNDKCIHIKGVLSDKKLDFMVQFNYMIDVPWLLSQLSHENRHVQTLLIHGMASQRDLFNDQVRNYPNVTAFEPELPITYGTHHSKMMVLFYGDNTMRIVIHTANMISGDWYNKTQGLWTSPILRKIDSKTESIANSKFRKDFCKYLSAYRNTHTNNLIQRLEKYDFSSIKDTFIGSVPGRHRSPEQSSWGHLRLRSILQKLPAQKKSNTVICQYSSCGSLGPNAENWLTGEFQASLSSSKNNTSKTSLKLVFPTVENVRCSFEGYAAGDAIPFDNKNWTKQQYMRQFLCQWRSEKHGRSRAMPHIKTYCRTSADGRQMAWFLLTSANLSKAAWGALEKNNSQLMIRSYEAGVLIATEDHLPATTFAPYDLPLRPYDSSDEPWTGNVMRMKPDVLGQRWPQ